MESGGGLSPFHIAVGDESGELSQVHRDGGMRQGPFSDTASWRHTVSESGRTNKSFSVLSPLFPAPHEGALASVLNMLLEPHRHSSHNSNQRENVQTVS